MMLNSITPDTQVTLLLCSKLGQANDSSPLNTTEYSALCQWLRNGSMSLKHLFEPEVVDQYIKISRLEPKRLHALLNRGGALALAVEDWTNKGIWIISRHDETYPKRLTERLSHKAPPLLFGVGNPGLLSNGGLAVVGSRDMSERARIATQQVGHLCAQNGIPLISGGARGVDSEGMQTVINDGGNVIGFVADSLLKTSVNGKYRQGLREQRLVLVTANDPKTPFSVGNAMARNKFVYCLSDWTLVIASSYNEGGTWTGAIENLKNRWVPLFVRKDVDVPEGNYRLIDKGGITLPPEFFSIPERFMGALNNTRATSKTLCVSDLTTPYPSSGDLQEHSEPVPVLPEKTVRKDEENILVIPETKAEKKVLRDIPDIWPLIEEELKEPKTDRELARQFKVGLKQMRSWLSVAVEKGDVKKLAKPVRYVKSREKNSLDIWIEN